MSEFLEAQMICGQDTSIMFLNMNVLARMFSTCMLLIEVDELLSE